MAKKDTKFVMRRVEDLIPYARNARTHSADQVARIAGSIKEFGFLNPVIISTDGGILAGHGRVMAAQKLGLEEVPCIEESHLTETQRRAYILADNRIALDAGWDEEMLRLELEELSNMEVDLSNLGFSEEERSALTENLGECLKTDVNDDFDLSSILKSDVPADEREKKAKTKNVCCPFCEKHFEVEL